MCVHENVENHFVLNKMQHSVFGCFRQFPVDSQLRLLVAPSCTVSYTVPASELLFSMFMKCFPQYVIVVLFNLKVIVIPIDPVDMNVQ